jgi:hypothetical protein
MSRWCHLLPASLPFLLSPLPPLPVSSSWTIFSPSSDA